MEQQQHYDYIIIGGGAAGLTSALYAARSGLKTLVFEEALAGGQAQNILELENYPALFPPLKGSEFSAQMENQAKSFGAEIRQNTVQSLKKTGDDFSVTTGAGVCIAPAVLLASGASPRHLGVPGETEFAGRGVSYCATCDGPFFRKKRVAVIGGGNSACDEALYLAALTENVTIIHRKNSFRAAKSSADRALNHPNITVQFDAIVTAIQGGAKVESLTLENRKTGGKTLFPVDGVFIFIGQNPRTELLAGIHDRGRAAEIDNAGYIVTGENMETSVPGLYCAGDVRAKSLRQVITAASDGAIAAHSAGNYIRELRGHVYR
ncbi:MAG: thioredoxin-disulfide reductase [Treponema sp.]|jgi:thioredoxin reductase (NADPH)|nr:thioredoxin-disulfide reductase [Treponema sp.]